MGSTPPSDGVSRATLRAGLLVALLLALTTGAASQAEGPTLDAVRVAVDDYFADDAAARTASHSHLKQWGDAAIPHLRVVAGEPSSFPTGFPFNPFGMINDLQLVCAVDAIGTPAAIDLLMDIADSTTGVAPNAGLDQLTMGAGHKYEDELKEDAHFKALVLRSTLSRGPLSSIQRSRAARTIGELGWTDAVEVLEPMAHDSDLSVAESAAEAIFKLTGRVVEIDRPALRFPGRLEGPAPFSEPRDVQKSRRMRGRFGCWRDGQAGLLVAEQRSMWLIGADGQPLSTWQTPTAVGAFLSYRLPSGAGRWIVGTTTAEFGNEISDLVASDWEGETLWRIEPEQAEDFAMAVLYDEEGACGVALASDDEGLRGLDDAGQPLFQRWGGGIDELRSHPQLPRRLLVNSGDLQILDAAGKPTTLNKMGMALKPRGPMFFADSAVMFPDRKGAPAIVAVGNGMNMSPVIVRLDDELAEVWRATVPGDVRGLAMLEPDDGPRVFVAACETGELYVFDANGAAFEPITLVSDLKPGGHMWVYGMDAGPFDEGSWGVAIALLDRTVLLALE